jgi:hypothetical protein
MPRYLIAVILFVISLHGAMAQDIAAMKHKRKLLKGQWQLVKTVNNGTPHDIGKEEYDAVITFKCFHKYQEEVIYEGYHWLIKGRWKVYRKRADLELTKLQYVYGAAPGAQTQDIHFSLYQLDKTRWGGDTQTTAEKIKMEYQRIPKKEK